MGFHIIAGATLTVAETEVFNGSPVNAWTDLDLSGTIGTKSALVLLKITHTTASLYFSVRKNGDTDEFYATAKGGVAYAENIGANHRVVFVVATDSSGVIEWKSGSTSGVAVIDIIAYIK